MTTREMIMKLWDLSGHASDLYPFYSDTQSSSEIDPDAEGTEYFLELLSQGQIALINIKKSDGRFLRFRKLYQKKNIQLGIDCDTYFTVTRTAVNTFEIDPTQTGFNYDLSTFENALHANDSSYYKIMTVTELSPNLWTYSVYPEVDEDDDTVYPETYTEIQFPINEFDVYNTGTSTNKHRIDLPERVYQILRIDDYQTNTEVRKVSKKDELASGEQAFSVGTPEEYQDFGSKIIFDTALDDYRWYRFEYFQQPDDIDDIDTQTELPLPFHQALIYWCQWQIALRERQEIHATNYRRLLDKELMTVRDEYDNEYDRSKTEGFKIRRS